MKYLFLTALAVSIFLSSLSQTIIQPNRVIVLSGGGSRGAWGGGFLKAMDSAEHPNYVAAVGNSTGSLLGPLILSNDPDKFNKLHIGYTHVEQNSIFNVNPFNKKGNVKAIQSFLRFITGSQNIGESKPLRKRITEFYSPANYANLRATGKEFVACVTNLTSGAVEYKSSNLVNDYDDMVDWVWASCNQPVFMSTLQKDNSKYVDGGIRDNIPIVEGIQLALDHHVNRVDIVIHNSTAVTSLRGWPDKKKSTGIIPKIFRVIDIFSDETRVTDIIAGAQAASQLIRDGQTIELHMYSMPIEVFQTYNCYNSLIFEPERQSNLWDAGYAYYAKQKGNKATLPDVKVNGIEIYLDK